MVRVSSIDRICLIHVDSRFVAEVEELLVVWVVVVLFALCARVLDVLNPDVHL